MSGMVAWADSIESTNVISRARTLIAAAARAQATDAQPCNRPSGLDP
jgi:hypothetical protein